MTQSNFAVYGSYAYRDSLIIYGAENIKFYAHREERVQKCPLLNAYIEQLDEEMLSERPTFDPPLYEPSDFQNGNINKPPEEDTDGIYEATGITIEQDISEEWMLEDWQGLFQTLMDRARTDRFCFVQLYEEKPYWRVFGEKEVQYIKYDEKGNPIFAHVRWSNSLFLAINQEGLWHEEDLIFEEGQIETDNEGRQVMDAEDKPSILSRALFIKYGHSRNQNKIGKFELQNVWSISVNYGYINMHLNMTAGKIGAGFMHWVFGENASPTDKDNAMAQADYLDEMNGIGAKKSVLEEIRPIYPSDPEFLIEALVEKKRQMAFASRLPLSFYHAEKISGGMGDGGLNEDEIKVNKRMKNIFGQFKKYFLELVKMRWGIVCTDVYPTLEQMEDENDVQDEKENEPNQETLPIEEKQNGQ